MNNIENVVMDAITESIESGIVEKLAKEHFEKCLSDVISNLFNWNGDITKQIEGELKAVFVKQLERFNYSDYVIKLDDVLTQVIKESQVDNRRLLDNFKNLMADNEMPKKIKVSELFIKYGELVKKEIDTGNLEICYDDSPSYADATITVRVDPKRNVSWRDTQISKINFCCEEDETLNICVQIEEYKENGWKIKRIPDSETSIRALRYLDDFKIYLLKLYQSHTKIELDVMDNEDFIAVEAEPEAYYS